ncbi:hypothetical protein H4582DRAFT_2061278 [Lactarius indigo]|nr:hypothetical protein H4582DRAFT_2061278 [Lactarius indigo]
MSNYEEGYNSNFNLTSHASPGFPLDLDFVADHPDEDKDGDEFTHVPHIPQYMSKPPLRLRPPINFSSQHSNVYTNYEYDFAGIRTTFGPSCSFMSGSTLHSSFNCSTAPHKASFHSIPPDVISTLTNAELLHNPLYAQLCEDHLHISSILTKYIERDLAVGFRASSMYQGEAHKVDVTTEKAVEDLHDSIVAPLVHPQCLPELVFLWRNEMDTRMGSVHPTSPHSNLSDLPYPLPPAQSIPQFQEPAPLNAAKWAFELSPGPKSPSASHTQKHSKDSALISRQKAMGTRSNEGQRPAARNITPTFLSRMEMTKPTILLSSFKQDPSSPDIDKDNMCQGWGHNSSQWDIGNIMTAFKLVAATIKTCQEVRLMCKNAGTPKTSAFISNIYLKKTLECLESCWVLTSQACIPPIPTTPLYCNVAMLPPCGLTIKLKWVVPAIGIITSETPEAPTGAQSTNQQCATSAELVGPSVGLNEGAHVDAALLKLLQVPELLALFIDNKLSAPKWKCNDNLIVVILMAPELSHVLKSTITEIIKTWYKLKKGSPKQVMVCRVPPIPGMTTR